REMHACPRWHRRRDAGRILLIFDLLVLIGQGNHAAIALMPKTVGRDSLVANLSIKGMPIGCAASGLTKRVKHNRPVGPAAGGAVKRDLEARIECNDNAPRSGKRYLNV